jgi:hypothetical protein
VYTLVVVARTDEDRVGGAICWEVAGKAATIPAVASATTAAAAPDSTIHRRSLDCEVRELFAA